MFIQAINGVKLNNTQVRFQGSNKESMSNPNLTSTVKAIPLAVLLAMSPLNTVDVKAQNSTACNVETVLNEPEVIDKNVFNNATIEGEPCLINFVKYNDKTQIILDFPTQKYDSYTDIYGNTTNTVKYYNIKMSVDTLKQLNITQNIKGNQIKYYIIGNAIKTSSGRIDVNSGEVVNPYSASRSELDNYKKEISPEFFEYLKDLTKDNSVPYVKESMLKLM